jgi:hypothetical protein
MGNTMSTIPNTSPPKSGKAGQYIAWHSPLLQTFITSDTKGEHVYKGTKTSVYGAVGANAKWFRKPHLTTGPLDHDSYAAIRVAFTGQGNATGNQMSDVGIDIVEPDGSVRPQSIVIARMTKSPEPYVYVGSTSEAKLGSMKGRRLRIYMAMPSTGGHEVKMTALLVQLALPGQALPAWGVTGTAAPTPPPTPTPTPTHSPSSSPSPYPGASPSPSPSPYPGASLGPIPTPGATIPGGVAGGAAGVAGSANNLPGLAGAGTPVPTEGFNWLYLVAGAVGVVGVGLIGYGVWMNQSSVPKEKKKK